MQRLTYLLLLSLISVISQAEIRHVYFGTGGRAAEGIYHATFDTESGKLSDANLAAKIGSPGFLAMHPDRSTLYAVCRAEEPSVAAYRINPNGTLRLINTRPIGDGGGAHISVHPSGQFLLTAQYGGGSVAAFPLSPNGHIEARSQLLEHQGGSGVIGNRQDSPHPHWTGYSPDRRFAFVPDLGLDQIVIYRVAADEGSIRRHGVGQSIPGGGPRHMRFSPDGKYIYLLNELSLSVSTFAYDAEAGTANRLTTTPALAESVKSEEGFNSASEILVHPNGRFVYSANRGNDSVTVYQANPATGQLTVQEVEAIRGCWPRNINLDPSGQWLLAAGADSNTISVFQIDPKTGKLSFQTHNIISVPNPICILF